MSVWDDLRNRITSNLSFAVKQPAQFARGVSLGVQQVSPKIPSRFNIPAQLNATRQIATPVLQNYMKWNEKFKPTTMPVISAAKTAGSEYWKNIQQTANIARNRPVTPWNVAKTMGAAAMTGFNLPFQFVTKDVENMVERTPLKFARVKTPVGTLSASGVAGFGAVMAMPMGSPERFAKIAKFTDVNKIATELRGLKIAEKEIPALSKKLVNIKNIDEVTNVIKGHLDQLKGIITDPAQVQEIRTSIAEGQNILRSGTFNGRKLSTEELIPVRKSVENSLAKIGESRFKKPTGYSIQDVTPEGYGPTQATKGVEKYKWFNQQDKIFVPAENAKSAPIEGLDTFVHKDPMGGGWKVTEAKSGGAMSEAFKTQKEAIANATSRLQAFKKAGNDINAHIEKVSRYNSPSGVEGGVATTAKKVETLLDEATALRQARQGTGAFKGGEVYEQDLGRIGTRQVLVQGKDAEGNILGWYLPDKKSADILGQKTGFLQPAKFTTSELQPSTTPTAKIKTAINWMFPEKPVSGKLTQAPEESINLIKEAVAKNDIPAAKSLYKDIGKEYQLPKFDQLQNEVGLEYEQTLTKMGGVERPVPGSYGKIAQKMTNFLRIAGENRNIKTNELYREHIPRSVFGISSDEVSSALGKSEGEFMADIMPDMIATAFGRADQATVNRFAIKVKTLKSLGDKLNPEFFDVIKGEGGKLEAVSARATPETLAKTQEKALKSEFINWEAALFKQEGAGLTPSQYTRQGVKDVAGLIKTGTVSPLAKNVEELKDISGFKANWRDMYRNFKEVFGKRYEDAKRIVLDPFDQAKGTLITNLNKWEGELDQRVVKGLGIAKGSKESAAVQKFGEGEKDVISLVTQFGEKKANNIVEADKWFRSSYDQLLKEVNSVRERIYPNDPKKIIPRRTDYYRHFRELAEGYRGLLNIFETPAGIPSTLAGISYQTEPKSKFLSFAQRRLGGGTKLDAVGGFIEYVKAAEYAKNIDPQIPRFRALATELAEQTVEGPNKGKLNNFILSLTRAADDLAGKTNPSDRWIQEQVPGGRTTFRVIDWINRRAKANVMLGNLSSSIAQIFNVPQGIADAGPVNATKGLGRALASMFTNNRPMEDSIFIKERYNKAFEKFDTGMLHNVKRFAYWVITALDEVGTKYIWNAEYSKAIANKIDNPVRYADYLTREMVAGRGVGEVPLAQKARLTQLLAPFQIEVGNLWWVMKDMVDQKAFGKIATLFIASYLFNRTAEQVRGSGVSFDPIKAVQDGLVELNQENYSKKGWLKFGGRQVGEVLSNIPGGQSAAALYPEYGAYGLGTRKELFGREDPTRFGTGVLVARAAQDPFFKLLPAYGGVQVEKTLKGIKAYTQGYQANSKGKVQYPVAQNLPNLAKTVAFGPTSLPAAQQYFNTGGTPLSERQSAAVMRSPDKEQAYQYFMNQRYINKIGDIYKQISKGEVTKENGLKQIEELKKKIKSATINTTTFTATAGGKSLKFNIATKLPTVKLKKPKKGKKIKLAKWRTIKAKTIKTATLKTKKITKPTAYKIKGLKAVKTPGKLAFRFHSA